jgi:soluble lytic murein transglycosylase-like protein
LTGLIWADPARAELVRFTSGQVMSVKAYRVEGGLCVLVLRGGGEMRAPASVVAEVLPDEVPHPDPVTEAAPAVAPAVKADSDPIRALINRLAAQFGVDPKLAHAVVQVESNYQPRAVSPKGAMGLMQLMPVVAKEYALQDPFDPEQNLSAGLQHLRGLLDRYQQNEATALAAYNAGEGSVSRYGGIPPFPETKDYVQQVLALKKRP